MISIVPAIDLRDGKCVRLFKGDYTKQTTYSDSPIAIAREFESQGAQRLHVVDLDGAKAGTPSQNKLISSIAEQLTIPVQTGGGIRTAEHISFFAGSAVQQVILGTVAVQSPEIITDAIEIIGKERLAIALDFRDGMVSTSGWLQSSGVTTEEFLKKLTDFDIAKVIVTDISRDGTLQGPDVGFYQNLAASVDIPITVSGGIGSLEDIRKIASAGIQNITEIIVGKALYEKRFTLAEAIRTAEDASC